MIRQTDIEKNQAIKETYLATLERRKGQECKVFKVKIQENKLNAMQCNFLKMVFVEAKWMYNATLALSKQGEDVFKMKYTDFSEVTHLDKDRNPIVSTLTYITSQMRQDVLTGIWTSIRALAKSKAEGNKVGELGFISDYTSINLKQYGTTYKIVDRNKIKIQGCKKPFKVNGLKQLRSLGQYELANAKLLNTPDGYYIAITTFVPRTEKTPVGLMGVDFGCQTSLTCSDGTKYNCTVEETDRIKRLKRKASRQVKGSKNSRKTWGKIGKLNAKLSRKRDDAANKVAHELYDYTVVMQDEQLRAWSHRHGKKIQYGILGRVKARFARREDTVVLSKWCPTTKLCTCCGERVDIKLNERTFVCPHCGATMDRDVHAAQNMLWFYEKNIGVGRTDFKPAELWEEVIDRFPELKQEAAKSLV